MTKGTVPPKPQMLSEVDFHAELMADWNRLERKWGKPNLALRLGLSIRQLGNIQSGQSLHPQPHRVFNLLVEDEDALSHVLRKYNLKAVPVDAVCSNEPGTLRVAVLLHHIAAAEHPESPGGVEITEHEARNIPEEDLLAAERVIARVRLLRKPKAVA